MRFMLLSKAAIQICTSGYKFEIHATQQGGHIDMHLREDAGLEREKYKPSMNRCLVKPLKLYKTG